MRANIEEKEQVNAEDENKEGENSTCHSKIIKTSIQILKKEEADEEKKPMKRKKIATSKQSMELASK